MQNEIPQQGESDLNTKFICFGYAVTRKSYPVPTVSLYLGAGTCQDWNFPLAM